MINWRKSTRSGGDNAQCVEIATVGGTIGVRDSKNPDGPKLTFSRAGFAAFTAEAKSK